LKKKEQADALARVRLRKELEKESKAQEKAQKEYWRTRKKEVVGQLKEEKLNVLLKRVHQKIVLWVNYLMLIQVQSIQPKRKKDIITPKRNETIKFWAYLYQ